MNKKWILPTAAFIGASGAALGVVGNYFYNTALRTGIKRKPGKVKSSSAGGEVPEGKKIAMLENESFKNTVDKITISLKSADGLNLKAHKYLTSLENENRKWVIVVHGYNSKSSDMLTYIRNFINNGFNVLALDLRGHGESGGGYIGMGWHDRMDLKLWVEELAAQDPNADIILFGLSMGAATVMMASGEKLPPNVKAIVEDCGYTSITDEFSYQLKNFYRLPVFPILRAASTVTRIRAGYSFYSGSALKQIPKNRVPILFIHGDKDAYVPFEMLDRLYNAANSEKEKLVIENARHAESVYVDPDKYWGTIFKFCDKYTE